MPAVRFAHPWCLLWFVPLAAYTLAAARSSLAGLSPRRSRLCLRLRLLLLAMVTAALAGSSVSLPTDQLQVLFLLDRSASIPPGVAKRQLAMVNDAARQMPPNARAGVVVFGREALQEREPRRELSVNAIHSVVGAGGSDLSAAVRAGLAILPESAQRRLVVVSDGNETEGDALQEAAEAAAGGPEIDAIPVEYRYPREALLERLSAPERGNMGEPLDIRVVARSTVPQVATLRLMRDGALVAERPWRLRAGLNAFPVTQVLRRPGLHTWEAVLEPTADTLPDNNRAEGFTYIQGRARVLLVEGSPGDGAALEQVLRRRSIDIERRGPGGLPATLAGLQGYDGVLLVNVRADQVTPEGMRLVRSAVQDLGLGLVMVGGPESLTAGGWHGTPIEEALPVEMQVRRRPSEPALALVLVIDHSGSMSGTAGAGEKLAYAKQAAMAATAALRPEDEVGVLAFDDAAEWALPLGRPRSLDAARGAIDSIGIGGGTEMYPALQDAAAALRRSHASLKHLLVLTDGQSSGGDFDGLARRMAAEKITMSTIGVGPDADGKLLSRLAALASGRYYPASDARTLPLIFDRETRLAARSAIVEETFRPQSAGSSTLLGDLPPAPPLFGYVATTARSAPGVEVPLRSDRDDPVVADWRFGLGRAAVVTTDAKARWAAPWLAGENDYFDRFWPRLVRSILRPQSDPGLHTEVAISGERGRVAVDAFSPQGEPRNGLALSGKLVGPDGTHRLRWEQSAPGRYEASFAAPAMGQYLAVVSDAEGFGTGHGLAVGGAAVPYSPEYRTLQANMPLLRAMAERTHGRTWPSLGPALHSPMLRQLFRPGRPAHSAPRDLWPLLAFSSALLLPLDIGLRRLTGSRRDLADALVAALVPAAVRRERRPGPQDPAMGRLLQARRRAGTLGAEIPAVEATSAAADRTPGASRAGTPDAGNDRPPAEAPGGPGSEEPESTRRLLDAKRRATPRQPPR